MQAAAVLVGVLAAPISGFAEPQRVTVFAAASLTNALHEIGRGLSAAGGPEVTFSFAASSTLAKQIEAGATADLYVSADEPWMDYLQTRKLIAPATRATVASNGLVLVVPSTRPVDLDIATPGWISKLGDGRIAIADPAHVPAGRYARQALTRLGAWAAVEPRLAKADNVRSALVLVARGEAVAGVVYATDARTADGKPARGIHVAAKVPGDSHDRIGYPAAIVAGRDRPAVRRVFDHIVRSPEARAVFMRHGYLAVAAPSGG